MDPATVCQPDAPFDLFGRGGKFNQAAKRSPQVYGQFATNGSQVNPSGIIPAGQQWSRKDPELRERLWLIEMRVRSVVQFGEAVPVLTSTQINNNANSRRGLIQVELGIEHLAGGDVIRMDGGQTLEVYAVGVNAQLFGPTNYVVVNPGEEGTIVPQAGAVENALVGLAILPIEESRDRNTVQFTQWVNVAQGATANVEVPPYARKLQIRQTADGAAAVFWALAPTPAAPMNVQVPVGATRQSDIVDVGNATQLRSDIDAGSARLFELVWTLQI